MKIKFSPKNALLIFSFRRENLWRMLSKILFLLSDLYCCYRLCLTNMFQYVMRILVQLFNFRRVFCIFNIFFFLYVTNISWNGKYRIIVSAGLYDKQFYHKFISYLITVSNNYLEAVPIVLLCRTLLGLTIFHSWLWTHRSTLPRAQVRKQCSYQQAQNHLVPKSKI